MASVSDQFLYTDIPGQSDEYVDFDQFLDFSSANGDDYSASVNSISPEMALPYDANVLRNDLPEFSQTAFPDLTSYDVSQESCLVHQSMGWIPEPAPVLDDAMFQGYQPYGASLDFRQMVEAQAAADPRIASAKEKRREAAIALHLQRLCDATALELDMSSDSSTSFSSPNLSDYMCESFSPQPASASLESTPVPTPTHANGGMELVLDLNMNATANLPKKQKPRSQAQKENYIKARKYGACEKHKKQHKRCNCLEKAAVRAGVNEAPTNVAFKERQKQPSLPPTLSDSCSPGVPGQVSSLRSPILLPTAKVIKRLGSTNSPRCGSSLSTSAQQQYIKTKTAYTGSVPGHDPRLNATAVLQTGQDGKRTGSPSGHVPPGIVQSIEPTRMPLARPSPRLANPGSSPTNNSGLCTGNKTPSQTSPRTTRLETRMLALGVPGLGLKRHIMEKASSPSALANQPHTPTGVRNLGLPGVSGSNQQPISPEGSRHALAITSTGTRSEGIVSSGVGFTGLFGPNGSIVRSVSAQIGSVSSRTVLSIATAWKSLLASASWLEKLIYTGLSCAGKQLMSARKGLQLYGIRAI